jgi:uncharacterized protein
MKGNCISPERRRRLLQLLEREFRLKWRGVHGAPHWARVRVNGLSIAALNGARPDVVELFSLLHDSQRMNDDCDSQHGARAGDFIAKLNDDYLVLDRRGLEMLIFACRYHSDGMTEADVTIQTCWDADRLDLARVGIWPEKQRLCTDAARRADIFEHGIRRSLREARGLRGLWE